MTRWIITLIVILLVIYGLLWLVSNWMQTPSEPESFYGYPYGRHYGRHYGWGRRRGWGRPYGGWGGWMPGAYYGGYPRYRYW